METVFSNIARIIPKLRTKIQLFGVIIAVVGVIATRIVAPDFVLSQIAGGAIGLVIMIFASITSVLPHINESFRGTFFIILFILTIALITILLFFTINITQEYNKKRELETNATNANTEAERAKIEAKKLQERIDSTNRANEIAEAEANIQNEEDNKALISFLQYNNYPGLGDMPQQHLHFLSILKNNNRIDEILLTAIENGNNYNIVRILLKKGADPNSKAFPYQTPLMLACSNSRLEIVDLLIKNKADVNQSTTSGVYPINVTFHESSSGGYILEQDIIALLVRNNVDINSKNRASLGNTLLKSVVGHYCEGTDPMGIMYIEFLLKHGADPTIRDDYSNENSIEHAKRCKNTKIIELFNKYKIQARL